MSDAGGTQFMKAIIIATDQPLLARGFEEILQDGGFRAAAVCSDLGDLFQALQVHHPDAAIVDISLLPSLAVISELRRLEPLCVFALRAIEISEEVRTQAGWLGVRAVLPHDTTAERLTQVLGILTSFPVSALPVHDIYGACEDTERGLISLASQGMDPAEMATVLQWPEPAVRAKLKTVLRRLEIRDRYELALHGLASKSVQANSTGETTPWKNETAIV